MVLTLIVINHPTMNKPQGHCCAYNNAHVVIMFESFSWPN